MLFEIENKREGYSWIRRTTMNDCYRMLDYFIEKYSTYESPAINDIFYSYNNKLKIDPHTAGQMRGELEDYNPWYRRNGHTRRSVVAQVKKYNNGLKGYKKMKKRALYDLLKGKNVINVEYKKISAIELRKIAKDINKYKIKNFNTMKKADLIDELKVRKVSMPDKKKYYFMGIQRNVFASIVKISKMYKVERPIDCLFLAFVQNCQGFSVSPDIIKTIVKNILKDDERVLDFTEKYHNVSYPINYINDMHAKIRFRSNVTDEERKLLAHNEYLLNELDLLYKNVDNREFMVESLKEYIVLKKKNKLKKRNKGVNVNFTKERDEDLNGIIFFNDGYYTIKQSIMEGMYGRMKMLFD